MKRFQIKTSIYRIGHLAKHRAAVLFLNTALLSLGCSRAPLNTQEALDPPETATAEHDPNVGAAEVRTGKDGRPLLIPVVLEGRTLTFLLDTGASRTVFDASLVSELGDPIRRTTVRTAAGLVDADEFACPDATVGGLPLGNVKSVLGMDLQSVRQSIGGNVRGVLGVDFLQDFLVTIDFDQGLVRLCKPRTSLIEEGETWIPMLVDRSGRPNVNATIGDAGNEMLLIDTGATGGGTVREDLYDRLVDGGEIATCNATTGLTVGGSYTQSSGYLSTLQVGPFRPDGPRVARSFENSVGLDWLSRFQVSLDFPNRRVLLKRGKRFDEPFSRATSGLVIIDVDGRKIIAESVQQADVPKERSDRKSVV